MIEPDGITYESDRHSVEKGGQAALYELLEFSRRVNLKHGTLAISTGAKESTSKESCQCRLYLLYENVVHGVAALKRFRKLTDVGIRNLHEPRDWRLALSADVHRLPCQSPHFDRHLRSHKQLHARSRGVNKAAKYSRGHLDPPRDLNQERPAACVSTHLQ